MAERTPRDFYQSLSLSDKKLCLYAYREYKKSRGMLQDLRDSVFLMDLSVPGSYHLAKRWVIFKESIDKDN